MDRRIVVSSGAVVLLHLMDNEGMTLATALRHAQGDIGFETGTYDAWQKRIQRIRAEMRNMRTDRTEGSTEQ